DFLISRDGENAFRLECRADIADDFVRRLTLYKLRAKVEIAKADQAFVTVAWEHESTSSQSDSTAAADMRFPKGAVTRSYGETDERSDLAAWQAFRIAGG
ncbi:MAG: folate-binding protein, partial [Mesorhizobium sp.]